MSEVENQFFVDSEYLSEKALEKKHVWRQIPLPGKIIWNICPGWKRIRSGVRTGYGSGEKL